jgi:hypothetical protein
MPSIFEENIRAATNAANNPNSIVNNTSTVAGVTATATGAVKAGLPGIQVASQIPGITPNLNVPSVTNSVTGSTPQGKKEEKPPFPNVLSQYTSYNYSFTLSILSPEQLNSSSYKRGDFGPLILRSASGAPDKDIVSTVYGKYDFYMDNLKIDGVIGYDKHSGNTNATGITFTVFEPYSMGLFFQAVQAAALKASYKNYLDVPILLTIEFKGHIMNNEKQQMFVTIPDTKKFIPMKIRNIGMKVTGKGSTYDVEAYPWNEQSFSSQFNVAKSDITIRCDTGKYTIQNILQTGEQSLQKVLNDYFKERVAKKEIEVANEIAIIFPTDLNLAGGSTNKTPDEKVERSATTGPTQANTFDVTKNLGLVRGTGKNATLIQDSTNGGANSVNKIGQTSLGFNELSKGDTPYPKENAVYDSAKGTYVRGNITVDVKNSDFKFNQASSIVDMINQVILMSDYARKALSEAERSPQGQITWWKVESQLYMLPSAESNNTGQRSKLAVFRVVPYLVDSQYLLPVNTQRPGLEKLKQESLKEYNYIYTGKNTEILDWNIDFRTGFYTALSADGIKNTEQRDLNAAIAPGAQLSELDQLKRNAIGGSVAGVSPDTQATPQTIRNERTSSNTAKQGGGGVDREATIAARQFQDILTSAFDQMNLSLSILGDPYYMTSSGYGNYNAAPSPYQNLNSDKSMNYQNGQVVITVNFRTPIDINLETGMYNFGDTKPLIQFSGLYVLNKITHEFTRGKFKQTLDGFRIKGQDNPKAPVKEFALNAESTSDAVAFNNATYSSIRAALPNLNNVNIKQPNLSLPGIVNDGVNLVKGLAANNSNPTPGKTPSIPGIQNNGGFTI